MERVGQRKLINQIVPDNLLFLVLQMLLMLKEIMLSLTVGELIINGMEIHGIALLC